MISGNWFVSETQDHLRMKFFVKESQSNKRQFSFVFNSILDTFVLHPLSFIPLFCPFSFCPYFFVLVFLCKCIWIVLSCLFASDPSVWCWQGFPAVVQLWWTSPTVSQRVWVWWYVATYSLWVPVTETHYCTMLNQPIECFREKTVFEAYSLFPFICGEYKLLKLFKPQVKSQMIVVQINFIYN